MITQHLGGKNSRFVFCFKDTESFYSVPVKQSELQDRMHYILKALIHCVKCSSYVESMDLTNAK